MLGGGQGGDSTHYFLHKKHFLQSAESIILKTFVSIPLIICEIISNYREVIIVGMSVFH